MPPFPINCPAAYGPCTPGKSVSGYPVCGGSPAVDFYLSKNSRDAGRSIVELGGFLYVAVELKITVMTSAKYTGFHFSEQGGVPGAGVNFEPCGGHHYHDYRDAYIYLMKINSNTGVWLDAENIAHFSGGDFGPTLIVDQDGSLVMAGTTADKNICGLPDAPGAEANLLIKIDPDDLSTIWQEHYLVDGGGVEGTCAFGLIQTADGGYVIIGNQEDDDENETFNIISFTPDCQWQSGYDIKEDYTVPGTFGTISPDGITETWNTSTTGSPVRVKGTITVPAGKRLVIDGVTVEFAYSKHLSGGQRAGITVAGAGGLVVRNGATLKGISCNGDEQMWEGVTVLGNPSLPPGTVNGQGFMTLTNSSNIRNAVRGTVLGASGWATETVETPVGNSTGTVTYHTYDEADGNGGGRITATFSNFVNCGKSIVWNPYPNYSNMSLLVNMQFLCDGPLLDGSYRPSGTALGEPTNAETFCELKSVRNVRLFSPRFLNTASGYADWNNRPSGILSFDSHYSLTGGASSTFDNLYVGAEAQGVASGTPSVISIDGAIFNQVYQGINPRGTLGTSIRNCQFNAMPSTANIGINGTAHAVYGIKSGALGLYDNILNGSSNNYGILVNYSAGDGARLERNKHFNFGYIANQFEDDNLNLQTSCNEYEGLGDAHWMVMGKLANQGAGPLSTQKQPDNQYKTDCDDTPLDPQPPFFMLDIDNLGDVFTYFEKPPLPQNLGTIVQCTENVVVNWVIDNDNPVNCAVEDPCPNPPFCEEFYTRYMTTGKLLQDRNILLNAYTRWDLSGEADSLLLPNTTRSINLLIDRDQTADRRVLVATYVSLGEYALAQQRLAQIAGTDVETQDFVAYYTVLVNAGLAGRDVYHLTESEVNSLLAFRGHNTLAGELANAVNLLYNGQYLPLEAKESSGERAAKKADAKTHQALKAASAAPNPFSGSVTFRTPDNCVIRALQITDVNGRAVGLVNPATDSDIVVWEPGKLPDGLYFYRLTTVSGQSYQGKLICQQNN